jgi:ABC-type polysaccharide/polyol phosphate transport system ATPase subunit
MTPSLKTENLGKAFLTKQGIGHTLSLRLLAKFKKVHLPQKIFVFEKVNLEIHPGECIGIGGANGSGKSTLLRCMGDVLSPTEGSIHSDKKILALLSHGLGAYEELPVWKNMVLNQQLLGLRKSEAIENLTRHAELAELKDRLASPMTQLSEGMRAKVALTALYFVPFDILLLDESLNHVDTSFREWFFELTRQWLKQGRSIVLTSHDENLLKHFCTRQLLLKNKSLLPISH